LEGSGQRIRRERDRRERERERERPTDRQTDRKRIGVFGGGDMGKECGFVGGEELGWP